jgi:hypothetical protein
MRNYVLRTAAHSSDENQEAREALNAGFRQYKSIGALAADTQFVYEAGTLVRQLADTKFRLSDVTQLLFERRQGPGLGNRLEIEEFVNTARVVERSLGGKPLTYTPHKKKYAVALKDYRIDFAFELEQILTGQMKAEIWADFMGEAVTRFFLETGLSAIDTACGIGVLDAYGKNVRTNLGGALDATTVDTALKRLGDVNEGVTIIGRYSALFPILGFTGYSDNALEEIRQTGAVGRYKGANIVIVKDQFNPFFNKASIPANRVYFVGGEKGGVLYEEDMSLLDYQEVDQEEQHFRVGTKLRATFKVFKPWMYHVVQTT